MLTFGVASTVTRFGVVMMVVRRWGRSVVVVRREVVGRWIGRFVLVDNGFLFTVVVVVVVVDGDGDDTNMGRLTWIVVVVDGAFVGLSVVDVWATSDGLGDGWKDVVVLLGVVVRVGPCVVGAGKVVASWTDWNVCSLMLSSVVVDGNFVKTEFCVDRDASDGDVNLSMLCCSALDSVLLSVLKNVVIGTYRTVVVSNLVELEPLGVLLLNGV